MYKLCFYVEEPYLEKVKAAVFAAGAGSYDGYSHCCWQTVGQGQFCPMAGSQPFLGEHGKLEVVAEFRVEVLVPKTLARTVVLALINAHPYEVPAYDLTQIITLSDLPV